MVEANGGKSSRVKIPLIVSILCLRVLSTLLSGLRKTFGKIFDYITHDNYAAGSPQNVAGDARSGVFRAQLVFMYPIFPDISRLRAMVLDSLLPTPLSYVPNVWADDPLIRLLVL